MAKSYLISNKLQNFHIQSSHKRWSEISMNLLLFL